MTPKTCMETSRAGRLPAVCLVAPFVRHEAFPSTPTGLLHKLRMLCPLTREIFAIIGHVPPEARESFEASVLHPRIHFTYLMFDSRNQSLLLRIPKFVIKQIAIARYLAKLRDRTDVVIFSGGGGLVLPLLTTRVLKMKSMIIITGSASEDARHNYGRWLFGLGGVMVPYILNILDGINYKLTDKIMVDTILPTGDLSKQLMRHRAKIHFAGASFVDSDLFRIKRAIHERESVVGYIGRLSEVKGVINFVRAMPLILEMRPDVSFLIGGDGELCDQVKQETQNSKLNHKVTFTGWIPNEELPDYLNRLALYVHPSYSEGLPHGPLETMACGTPVLATPVGSVPDFIRDGETGFILENNSPECIARNVMRALAHPNLAKIVTNARQLIEKEYGYEVMTKGLEGVLEELMKGGKKTGLVD